MEFFSWIEAFFGVKECDFDEAVNMGFGRRHSEPNEKAAKKLDLIFAVTRSVILCILRTYGSLSECKMAQKMC